MWGHKHNNISISFNTEKRGKPNCCLQAAQATNDFKDLHLCKKLAGTNVVAAVRPADFSRDKALQRQLEIRSECLLPPTGSYHLLPLFSRGSVTLKFNAVMKPAKVRRANLKRSQALNQTIAGEDSDLASITKKN